MDITEMSTPRFKNVEKSPPLGRPTKNNTPRDEASSFGQDIGMTKARRLRKKMNTRRRKETANDGYLGDDEHDYEQKTHLSVKMSSNASISQHSGLTNFSDGVQFSPDEFSKDQSLFTPSRPVDTDSLVDSYISNRSQRDTRFYPKRRRRHCFRQRRRCVSEQELDVREYIGPSGAHADHQYQAPDRVWFEKIGLEKLRDESPEKTLFQSSRRQSNAGNLRKNSPGGVSRFAGILYNQRTRVMSEPLDVVASSSSDDLGGALNTQTTTRPRSEHGAQRYGIPVYNYDDQGDYSMSDEDYYHDESAFYPKQWDGGESSMISNQDGSDEGSVWTEPEMTRETQRSTSVPEIQIQDIDLLPEEKSHRYRRSRSLGEFDDILETRSRLNFPGSTPARVIHPSTKVGLLSLVACRKDRTTTTTTTENQGQTNLDLRTSALIRNAHQSGRVVCPLTQEYVSIHDNWVMRRADNNPNDSCYGSAETGTPRRENLDENLASVSSRASSNPFRPTFENDDGRINEARSEHLSPEEIVLEMESQENGEPKLTVVQSQDQEGLQRASSGQTVYIKVIKCVVFLVIVLIVLACVVFVVARHNY